MTAACLVAASALLSHEAGAWSNGREGPNRYGTHDWLLDQPIKRLRRAGDSVNWVRLAAALRATDNPDTVDGIEFASSPWWHVYDIWGSKYGGAPEAIEHWHDVAAERLAKGRKGKASKALGIMAHLLGDLANPMHTDQKPKEESLHSRYESEVDERVRRTSSDYTFYFDGRQPSDPFRRAVKLAKRSHQAYDFLLRNYSKHGFIKPVDRVTQKQLNRGANAIADLAAGIKMKAQRIKKESSGGGGGGGGGGGSGCDPSYPDFCIPPPPPDKDCEDVNGSNFTVKGNDPHGFDADGDGVGCES